MPSKVYIIGKIPEVILPVTQKKFSDAQKKLENLNIEVFNPIQSFLDNPESREVAISNNIMSLLSSNAVYILNDISSISENQIELLLASKLNKLIMHEF
jgi:hypothetical protein